MIQPIVYDILMTIMAQRLALWTLNNETLGSILGRINLRNNDFLIEFALDVVSANTVMNTVEYRIYMNTGVKTVALVHIVIGNSLV